MNEISAKDAKKKLIDGNKRFVDEKSEHLLQGLDRRKDLIKGQSPWAIILSCADSRVAPELTFDAGLGELFVIRVAGNTANTESIASIEYAVAHLGTKLIVVLGHESCGAVGAAISGGDNGHNLNVLLAHLNPAVSAFGDGPMDKVVKTNAQNQANDLAKRSSIISEKMTGKEDSVEIVSAYYHLEDGAVEFL